MADVRIVRVIRDQDGNFVKRNSITKSGKNKYSYTSSRTFSRVCRGYLNEELAKEVLSGLNAMNDISNFGIVFHIEKFSMDKTNEENDIPQLSQLIKQDQEFEGEKIIEIFKTVTR